jgi:hypothetical protein
MRVPTDRELDSLHEQLRTAMWGDNEQVAMSRLAQSFPSLHHAAGVDPWDPRAFVTWVCSRMLSPAGEHAARFVLEVWGPTADWRLVAERLGVRSDRLGVFDAVEAMRRWDDVHRAAFATWAAMPFFGSANAVARDSARD